MISISLHKLFSFNNNNAIITIHTRKTTHPITLKHQTIQINQIFSPLISHKRFLIRRYRFIAYMCMNLLCVVRIKPKTSPAA